MRISMSVDLIVGIACTVVVLILGLLIILGLGDNFISGYNTASEEKKARYNLRRLRMSTGIIIFVLTAVVWLTILLQLPEYSTAIVVGVVAVLAVVIQKFYVMK